MIHIFQGGKATERSVTAWTATPEFLWGAELLVLHPEHFLAQVSLFGDAQVFHAFHI